MTSPEHYTSARLRLALSYAIFLVAAGAVVLVAVYVVLHQVPNYPLTPSNPRDRAVAPSRQEILQTLVVLSAFVLAGLAVIGVTGGWLLAGWVLRPLRQINAAAHVAAGGDLTHRIHLAGRNDEFRQVADSFDLMLDRLQESFEIRERFAANASHELRTPLTVTATLLEVAERDPHTRTDPDLLERLARTNARAIALVDALLRMAGADGNPSATTTDLAGLTAVALAELAEHSAAAGLQVTERLEPAATGPARPGGREPGAERGPAQPVRGRTDLGAYRHGRRSCPAHRGEHRCRVHRRRGTPASRAVPARRRPRR